MKYYYYKNNFAIYVNTIQKKNKTTKIKYIIDIPENKKHLFYILITLIYSIIISMAFTIMWASYYTVYNRISFLIKSHGNLSNDAYKLINYYQLMIFHNYTIEDINMYESYNQTRETFSNIYSDIEQLYISKKIMNKLTQYNLGNIDSYYNFTCQTFYEYLFRTNNIFKNKDIKYKDFLTKVCEISNIFKSNNYKLIFSILLEYIQIGINEINDHTYNGLISIIHKAYFPKIIIFFLTVYNYAFEILGGQLQRKSYIKITSTISNYINISFIIYYISSFAFILIIIFGYVININNHYNRIQEVKKVFKICNKKD